MRIILAEDEPLSRELVLRMLRARTDHDITAVDNGEDALALALAEPTPDVLLLDWMMPGMSGTDVCARVRESRLPLQPYIVLLTAKSKHEEALQALRVGADDFLSKPVAPDTLIARISPARHRPVPGQSQSRAVAKALFRARDQGDGELIVKDGFVPQRRRCSADLLFDLEDLLSDELHPAAPKSIRPPAPPATRLWQDAFSTPEAGATQTEIVRVLDDACLGEGVLGAAVIDRLTGVCLMRRGCDLNPDVAWAHLQTLNVLSRQERVEDAIVVTDTRYHLVRFIPSTPDCFVYLVVDAKRALIAAARLALQRAVGS